MLLLSACLNTSGESPAPSAEDLQDLAPASRSATPVAMTEDSLGPTCPQRTDRRTGNGAFTLTLTLDTDHTYTVRPLSKSEYGEHDSIPNTETIGYDPEVGVELFVGEKAVVYSCDEYAWFYRGDLDVDQVIDRPNRSFTTITQRRWNEDGTPQPSVQVKFPGQVTGLVFHQ